jgi:LysM repeat protein
MAGRKPARYLAPVALLATAAAIGIEVKNHVGGANKPTTTNPSLGGAANLSHSTRLPSTGHHHRVGKFYIVRSGNTLSGIVAKTGVSMATIVRLNPGLNPSALQTGQRLRLRR